MNQAILKAGYNKNTPWISSKNENTCSTSRSKGNSLNNSWSKSESGNSGCSYSLSKIWNRCNSVSGNLGSKWGKKLSSSGRRSSFS